MDICKSCKRNTCEYCFRCRGCKSHPYIFDDFISSLKCIYCYSHHWYNDNLRYWHDDMMTSNTVIVNLFSLAVDFPITDIDILCFHINKQKIYRFVYLIKEMILSNYPHQESFPKELGKDIVPCVSNISILLDNYFEIARKIPYCILLFLQNKDNEKYFTKEMLDYTFMTKHKSAKR